MRSRRGGERGENQMGCLIGLVFFLLGLFVAYKMVPIKIRAAELRQEVVDQAKSAGMRGDDRILQAILKKAEENRLPVTADQVNIRRTANNINVDVDYVVPVDFPGFVYQWHFHAGAENPIF